MRLTAPQYAAALVSYLEKNASSEALAGAFLTLLRKHHQERLLPRILLIADRLWKERHHELDAHLSTAQALRDDALQSLKTSLEKKFGKKIFISQSVTPLLKGGIALRVSDTLYDASLSGRLAKLRKQLTVDV